MGNRPIAMSKQRQAHPLNQKRPAPNPVAVLNRLSFGQTDKTLAEFQEMGLDRWLDKQLHPAVEPDLDSRLAQLKIRIKYAEAKDWTAVDEARPLQWLNAPIDKLWPLANYATPLPGQERARPRVEVAIATLLRGAYSQFQLKELLCDFWHNHFSVNAHDGNIGVAFPVYDREVIRAHCLGNFREFLEAVATSACMLMSLNNRSSRTGAPNENYARELFELHTLGRDAYLNSAYDRWRQVPGAEKGHPVGYIDQDVYEAARAFTGWGLEDGAGTGMGTALPKSGKFAYVDAWHDQYQKRVLGVEFDPYRPPMTDGRQVLDLVARHPATATNVIRKLAWRLGLGHLSANALKRAKQVWDQGYLAPDQIALVVRQLVSDCDFSLTPARLRRPLELVLAYIRATGSELTPTEGLLGEMDVAGQRLFGWSTPTGLPDDDDYWLGVNSIRRRWSLIAGLTENWWGTGQLRFAGKGVLNGDEFLTHWSSLLFGAAQPQLVTDILAAAKLPSAKPVTDEGLARRLVAWLAMSPGFQMRGGSA
jgi:uncharacterized protein (DUF1800 family)